MDLSFLPTDPFNDFGIPQDGFSILYDWMPPDVVSAITWIFGILIVLAVIRFFIGG